MSAIDTLPRSEDRPIEIVVRAAIVVLALATAGIHASLGGMLFALNAVGYGAFAVAMVAPGPFASYRWLVRLAFLGFTLATIGGWLMFGARFPLAYLDKAVEVALVVLLIFELWTIDGGPIEIARRARRLGGMFAARSARG